MARPRLHDDDHALDAARALFLSGGVGRATTAAICDEAGRPSGSLYHRFGSRQAVLVELWLRTVRRFQGGLLDACAVAGPGLDRALAGVGWLVDFADEQLEDARLLLLCRREDLIGRDPVPAALSRQLEALNEPIQELVVRITDELCGRTDGPVVEAVTVAAVDLPFAVVRRHLRDGTPARPHRADLLASVTVLLRQVSDRRRHRKDPNRHQEGS